MTRQELVDLTGDEDLLFADGFDAAIIGVAERSGEDWCVAYDTAKCIKILEFQGMSEDEAMEYFSFNVLGSYMGNKTPVFISIY